MKQEDFDAWETRVSDRADRLWRDAGSPEGARDSFLDEARELVAIEEVPPPTLDPVAAAQPVVEEAAIQGNLGEFPTLRDQGDEMTFPGAPLAGDGFEPRLSDGDASEDGGVLPLDEVPDEAMAGISVADADLTTSAVSAGDDPLNDDLNDDGMPDAEDLDDTEAEGEMEPGDEYEDATPPR